MKIFQYVVFMLALPLMGQTVTPMANPHPTFNNAVGLACAGCSLYSYVAGSTNPLATYTDSTGATQNTNPLILGADGGPLTPGGSSGAIWMGQSKYKFVLIDAQNNTVFTVDNVGGSGGIFPCGPAGAIQIANSGVTGLTCDPSITINAAAHSINVGTLPTAHVDIGSQGTPTSWNFDTTTPATALASLGGAAIPSGIAGQLVFFSGPSTFAGANAIPSTITATTQTPGDNSTKLATTAYVALPGAIAPTSFQLASGVAMTQNQGTGTAIQHSAGTITTGNFVKFDANGNTVDSGIPSVSTITQSSNLASSRIAGTVYQNTSSLPLYVTGNLTTGGSGTGSVSCLDGSTSSPTSMLYSNAVTASVSGGASGFSCMIPPGYYYEIVAAGTVGTTPANWFETTF